METILSLSYMAMLPVAVTGILCLLNKRTAFGKLGNKAKQLLYGVVFGGLAVIANEFGVDVGGAIANTRDASVLTAGLVFGAPAGIIAGVIGSVERFFCVYWGGGTYTRLACSLSTCMAGLFAGILRKYMFDSKKPSILYALAIGLVTEVMHMLMIFITNMSDIAAAFVYVKSCSLPMITANGLALTLSVWLASLLEDEKTVSKKRNRQIAVVAQRRLLYCTIAGFTLTCFFTAALQIQVSGNNTRELLRLNIRDVISDITDASNSNLIALTKKTADAISQGKAIADIAREQQIAEINIVDKNGIITESTNSSFIGYDMASGEQSAAFLVLLKGKTAFVQSYQPISYDESVSRKYAGVTLNGGFVQVGYDAIRFQEDIAREVIDAAANRHIGKSGYLLIADESGSIVSGVHAGRNIKNTGLGAVLTGTVQSDACFYAEVFGKDAYCMYQFREGYYGIAVLPESEATFSRDISIYMMVFMEIVIFVSLFILINLLIKRLVVDNIKSVNSNLAEITKGNLDVTVNVRSNDEFASLSDDINATVDALKQCIAEEAARIDRELELAKIIQESSLPSVFPPFPEKEGLDIFASMEAAREVGGDFYDFYLLDDSHLAFLVADVSGKGITAAMFMMKAKTLIKGFAERSMDPAEILTRANSALCEGNDADMFVTCFMGVLDLENRRMEFANAGHNPPLLRHKGGSFDYLKTKAEFVLGGMENIRYRKEAVDFVSGNTLFLYTDGVTEATNISEALYGEQRLSQVLNASQEGNAKDICSKIKTDVDTFVGEAPQFDDITMLCIRLG